MPPSRNIGPKTKKPRRDNKAPKIEAFKYESVPLSDGQIRRLELLPAASRTDPLSANLLADGLEYKAYEALSYTWGNEDKPCEIKIGSSVLPIGKNVDAALRQFRLPDSSRWLWADAICINQGDTVERTAQVAMMRNVYRFSNATLSWLGSESPEKDGQSTMEFADWLLDSHKAKKITQKAMTTRSLELLFEIYNAQAIPHYSMSPETRQRY